MKKSSYSFFDFLGDIVDSIIGNTGRHEDPYNINFTNHYKTLYNIEENLKDTTKNEVKISEIIQNKREKSLTVKLDNMKIGKDLANNLKNSFDEQKIEYNISNGKLDSFKISKTSKGVLEEREWEK